jgi:ABC-type branched-subunit amino acid transport system ATPase component
LLKDDLPIHLIMLRCEGLTKSFDGVHALVDVHLRFPNSGIVAIIGPNGAGKTTLLHVLTGFLRPDAGRCFAANYKPPIYLHTAFHGWALRALSRICG